MPSHPLALALIRAAGVPIAAPSANRFGHTSPTTADHVFEDLDGHIDAILDGGPTAVGVESTVLDPNQSPMLIYRPGAITPEMIEQVAGPNRIFQPAAAPPENPASLPSPGVGIRHYAPRAKLILVPSEKALHEEEEKLTASGEKIGALLPEGWTAKPSTEVFRWADWQDSQALAQRLFAGLRALDARGVTTILCPLPASDGIGVAIRDRLEKAARTK
jgi:L-threonylcarbamoyladenylate synthase